MSAHVLSQGAIRACGSKGAASSKKMEYHRFNSYSSLDSIQSNREEILCYACSGVGPPLFHSTVCEKYPSSLETTPRTCLERRRHIGYYRTKDSKSKWIFGEVLDPRNSTIRRYNKWFLLSCVLGAAVDPLFISVLSINKDLSCLYVQKGYAIGVTILRCMVDLVYIWHMWLQLKLAYVSKKSLFLGQGELVWDARTVAIQYLRSLPQFWFDIFVILPIPQVMLWVILPNQVVKGGDTTWIMNYMLLTFLIQYVPKVLRFIFIAWRLQHVTGYIFGSASWGFVLNLAVYFCAAHVAGSIWYLLTVQRVESCIYLQCKGMTNCQVNSYMGCPNPISYGAQPSSDTNRLAWAEDPAFDFQCLKGGAHSLTGNFSFGIYSLAVPIVQDIRTPINRIVLPLFWGIMTMSSFGNALSPTPHIVEVTFSILVIICGLLLFTLLIGNIQVFLHSTTARKVKSQLRARDIEWWMRRRQLPNEIRRRVRQYERHMWAATRGIDEVATIRDLPESLRRDIKRHLCYELVRKVPLFEQVDDQILNIICERLKPKLFTKNETVLNEGEPVRQMLFIVRGNIGSSYRLRHNRTSKCVLGPSHFCGDELISWCLSKPLRDNLPLSTTTLTTLTVTEAFALDALDLKYLTQHFQHKFANENLKRAVRSHSCSWQTWAAVTIQLGWRRHRARLSLSNTIATTTPDHSYADDHSETVSINAQHDPSSRFPLTPPLRAQLRSLRLYAAILCSPKPKDYLSS
uniref:Cyclic nucleotide-binding domain-containing protein n=1 Tax=Physcomitrium patens TaxID=3218 RepID=A0A2K1JCW3_PHYPA|nr:cyclic nucleotide-gated ion channel 2-like [Physcomitrium patens]PNR39348.1 hypothetical protein PHYPA_019626 [Physcomitrium patens]|eukprot:XP_024397361.1 cyclic nucleotide-gated ion channel 2-like [Physcomitrella patens]